MLRQLVRQVHGKAAVNKIVLANDESYFIAYHPKKEHPYEHTRPLPKEQTQDESLLKVNDKNMITEVPNFEQVQSLTYTHKSYWRKSRGEILRTEYKASFDDKVDRKGLTS